MDLLTSRLLRATVALGSAAAMLAPGPGVAATGIEFPRPGPDVLSSTCTFSITEEGVGIDPARPCEGVTDVRVLSSGDLSVTQTIAREQTRPVLAIRAVGTGSLEGRVVAGPSGGSDTTRLRVHSTDLGRVVDLGDAADRRALAGAGAGITVRWWHDADEPGPDVPTLPGRQHASGCVVRFTAATDGYPQIHSNSMHRCAGVLSVGVDGRGRLYANQTIRASDGLDTVEVWGQSDEMFADRGLHVEHRAGGTGRTTYTVTDLATGRELDLRDAADRARITCDTCNVWLGWIHASPSEVGRIAGEDRYTTAVRIAEDTHPSGAEHVYLATAATYPDALAAAAAAGSAGAPVLLVAPDRLPAATAGALTRLAPERMTVVGGESAVSDAVLERLDRVAPTDRVGSTDRHATAATLSSREHPGGAGTVLLATGQDSPDALSASALAGRLDAPVLLTRASGLPATTARELDRLSPDRVVVVGAESAVSGNVTDALTELGLSWERVGGTDRYDTAARLARWSGRSATTTWVATGLDYPDALTASAAAASQDAPVLLVHRDRAPRAPREALEVLSPAVVTVAGGPSAVAEQVLVELAGALEGDVVPR